MMLYIFHVDLGCTITVDINMTTKTVAELKERIEIENNIPPSSQILLMSGGETLNAEATVGSYSTGTTDSNPIFLFNAALIDSAAPPIPITNYVPADDNLDKRFTESQSLPVSFQTLHSRTELAVRCCTLSRDQLRACERLVHDQHLQQQGWAAVLANFDDVAKFFEDKVNAFQQHFSSYLEERQEYIDIIKNISSDLQTLSKIPILPALRAYAEGFLSPEEYQQKLNESGSSLSTVTQGGDATSQVISLLTWIVAKDKTSLDQVIEECSRSLSQFDEASYEHFKNDALALIALTKRQDRKEIPGLSERLFQLEQVVEQAKRTVSEQAELSQGFQQNMSRVNNLKDDSVLPDLCTSHKNQLQVMHNNYKMICDYRRRCTKAKEELSASIHRHLKWISEMENKIQESIKIMMLHTEKVKRLRRSVTILRQIHEGPEMYMSAVAEVVRRRTFSEAFLAWASNLAYQIMNIHSEEIQRRREFQSKFDGHFLAHLFPGLDDIPPPFATEAPASFDNGLPKLTVEDVEIMKHQLPDLASSILMPDLSNITQFFSSKSFTGSSAVSDVDKEKESNLMAVDESSSGKEQEIIRPPMLSDRGDFGSETDTEEFEKIGQAAMDSKQTSYDSTKQQQQQPQLSHQESQQKQLEESLNSSREEVERLRSIIRAFGSMTRESMQTLRRELNDIKEQALLERESSSNSAKQVDMMLKLQDLALRDREEKATIAYELKLALLKKELNSRNEEIEDIKSTLLERETEVSEQQRLALSMRQNFESKLKDFQDICSRERLESQIEKASIESNVESEKKVLQNTVQQCEGRIKELEQKLLDARTNYEKDLKEKCDKLHAEHKTEMETIRSRFKLMTASTMERSPSDSSLEKIERADVIELVNHETILAQAKKDLEIEKEEAIHQISTELQTAKAVIEKNEQYIEAMKQEKVALCKDYQNLQSKVDYLKNSESLINSLSMENAKLKSDLAASCKFIQFRETLKERDNLMRQLSDDQMNMSQEGVEEEEMKDSVKVSETKKVKLEKELSASVSVVSDSSPGRIDAATCTEEMTSSKHTSREKKSSSSRGKATLATCNRGDVVALVWDPLHENYIVLQDSDTKYFLNSDSLAALGLKMGRSDSPSWAFGEVVEKEFCKAKKAENRYKVSLEERFYRVRVKPYKKKDKDKGEKEEEKPSSSRSPE